MATQRVLLPSYAMQERRPFGFTLSHSISPLLPLVLLWLLCVVLRGPAWPRFERLLLATGAALNLAGAAGAGEGASLPAISDARVSAAVDRARPDDRVAQARAVVRVVAWAESAAAAWCWRRSRWSRCTASSRSRRSLTRCWRQTCATSHAGDLSGRVQCLDTIQDCLPTLYTLRLLPATGTLGDVNLFGPSGSAVVEASRRRFFDEVEAKPPLVFIVVSGLFLDGTSGYRKLDAWPAFEQWLNAHYTLTVERTPPHPVRWWSRPQPPAGYRLYMLKPLARLETRQRCGRRPERR